MLEGKYLVEAAGIEVNPAVWTKMDTTGTLSGQKTDKSG
jgi:hypothetical protein